MPSLMIEGEPRSHLILRKLTSIGRDPENDLVLGHATIAPTHAHIRLEGGRFMLVVQRGQPMRVNDRKSKKHVLEHGDEIYLGEVRMRFNLWDDQSTVEAQRDVARGSVMGAYERLASFSRHLAEQRDVSALFEVLMDEVVALTGADKGFLLRVQDTELEVVTARNLNRETIAASVDQVSDTIIGRVVEGREPVIVSDALNDTVFSSSVSVMQLKLCSVMCVPLVIGGALLGLIYVGNDNVVNLFDESSLSELVVFSSQAALLLDNAIQRDALRQDNQRLRTEVETRRFGSIIGTCDAMQDVFSKIEKVAGTDISVLVLGETGTGKELVARELHRRSKRADGPFVAVNCGAIPENLMESELFGHRRGAFTGAFENKLGSFEFANGGTLFLDEIGEMPPQLQVKLLRAIQERVVTRVGDTRPTKVDIRLVVATNVDLLEAIRNGRFREDLYYRINVVSVGLPALRDRDDDVVLIGRYLLERFAAEYERPIRGFTNEAIIALRKHAWPGNIRELENRLKKGIVLSDGPLLTADCLDLGADDLVGRVLPLAEAKEHFQRRYIDQVLALNEGNRTKTARDLGVDPRTVFRHLEKVRDGQPEGS